MITLAQVDAAFKEAVEALSLSPSDYQIWGCSANAEGGFIWFGFYGSGTALLHQIEISV